MLNISVIIPVYKAEAFLKKAVESALKHDEVKEILLVEDESPDNSLQICKELMAKYDKVKLFQHPDQGNHGAGASRNLGLMKVSQEFVAFLDADDYYLPNRFEAENELFKNEKIEGVFGAIGTEFLTEKGKKEFQEKFQNTDLTTVNFPAEGNAVFRGLLGISTPVFGTFFHLNTLTVRYESIKKNNLRFNENLRVHQDSDFIIKLSFACHLKSGIIDRAVAIRGVHDDNRITKIVRYSQQYNERQFLLWKSLYEWSRAENMDSGSKKAIFLNYKSFDLSLKKGLGKQLLLIGNILRNPQILKSRYRFTYFKTK